MSAYHNGAGAAAPPQVLAIGPFPPFVGGAAKNTAIVCTALEECGAEVVRLSTNKTRKRSEHQRSLNYYTDRVTGFLSNLGRIFSARAKRASTTVYLVPDGGSGVVFSAAYARVAATFFPRLVVHHRSYNHIRQHSSLMAWLMKTAPDKTLHVFLDPVMEERFKQTYSVTFRSTYVPNAATCDVNPVTPQSAPDGQGRMTVGFLSNLVEDKGFDVVAEAFPKLAVRLGPAALFLLAGSTIGPENAARLTKLEQSLGDQLEYVGEVFGSAKAEFYRRCDVFVFPTRFTQEAQPNVLYEAMAAGAAIVSTRWAGVPWVIEDSVSRTIEARPDNADKLVEAVDDLLRSRDSVQARAQQIEAFRSKKADADARYTQFIRHMLGEASM